MAIWLGLGLGLQLELGLEGGGDGDLAGQFTLTPRLIPSVRGTVSLRNPPD